MACSNTKRLPVPRSKDERNARKLQLLQTSSLSGVPSSRFPVLPTGIVALLLMGRSVCACTSASSSVVQAHILGQEQERKKINRSYGRQHQLWLAFVMQNSAKKITQGGWELGRIFGLSFAWGRLVSGTVIHMMMQMMRQMMHGRMLHSCVEQSAHWWSVKLVWIGMNLTWSD